MAGVVILGASRSGTSMTAGLFAKHGVWFGDCMPPRRINPKGFYENLALKRVWKGVERPRDFDEWWRAERERGGCRGAWGAKSGAERWPWWRQVADKTVIVLCYRDMLSIQASRKRAGFSRSTATQRNWEIMERIKERATVPVIDVWTPDFVEGNFSKVVPAFEAIGVAFDRDVATEWVDPKLWHHRGS